MPVPRIPVVIPLGAVLCCLFSNCGFAAQPRPNILFLFTDDHSCQAISAYGSQIIRTPNLDRIAWEGMRFDRCLVTNSICAPSRAVILTGKYSHLNGQRTNRDVFDGSQLTVPKLLKQVGYETAVIGKWHLKSTPTGFDHYEVLIGQGQYYNPVFKTTETNRTHIGYTTDIITDRAIAWLKTRGGVRQSGDKPFFLMCQHKAPHGRWEPALRHLTLFDDVTVPEPDTLFDDYSGRCPAARQHRMGIADDMGDQRLMFKYSSRFTPAQFKVFDSHFAPKNEAYRKAQLTGEERTRWHYQRYIKNYLRCVTAVDENIGRLLDWLNRNGLAENTVVIYSSDQGFYLGEHGWFDKRWMYEESLRAPLLVRWPGVVPPRTTNSRIVSNVDFAATFLDIADAPQRADMQGHSLVPQFKGLTPGDWRTSLYYHYYESGGHGVPVHFGVATDRFKLIHYQDGTLDAWELFDRTSDPQELHSLYGHPKYATVQVRLKAELARQRKVLQVQPAGPASGTD